MRNTDDGYPTLTDKSVTLRNYVISVAVIPGTVIIWPSVTGPPNNQYNNGTVKAYLYCDGTAYVKNTYPDLSNAIAIDFPHGSDLTQFRVPDLRATFLVGSTAAGSRTYQTLSTGGFPTATLGVSNLPQHNHTYSFSYEKAASVNATLNGASSGGSASSKAFSGNFTWPVANTGTTINGTTNSGNGNSVAFSIIPPYTAIFYFIKT
jgi:microcystin-dependent protein